MEEIGIERYLRPEPSHNLGRPGYNRVNMLKTVLFGFMDTGYASLRELEDRCKVNIRYMYLIDHEDPFRAVNFKTDPEGDLICPNGRKFHFAYRKPVRGNQYGRQEEYYTCEDCSGCPYAEKCKRTEKNRTVRINAELSAMHQEVLDNLQSIHGALLRMNRSIQAEGTFGIIKYDRWYKRIVRRELDSVRLELFLVSIGHNLYKFHNKQMRLREVA